MCKKTKFELAEFDCIVIKTAGIQALCVVNERICLSYFCYKKNPENKSDKVHELKPATRCVLIETFRSK